jgi:hypothetical protein
MAELTEVQLERAREAFSRGHGSPVPLEERLRAVAPYLQLPWAEATEKEVEVLQIEGPRSASVALNNFIFRRNAALLPKREDHRRKRILDILREFNLREDMYVWPTLDEERYVDRILAVLDEER